MQFAERRFTGHTATGQHASPAQAAASLVHVQFNSALVALRHRDHHHAVVPRTAEAGKELWIVARPGAAAVALQHQTLNAAVEQPVEDRGADSGEQRQYRNVRQ